MRYTTFALTFALAALSVVTPTAQEKIDKDIQWKIRREATDNSQILRTLHFLTDVYGPRLTGSPNLKAAQDWVVKETTALGPEERAPRAVDVRPSGLGEREAVGARRSRRSRTRWSPRRWRGRPAPTARSPRRPCS